MVATACCTPSVVFELRPVRSNQFNPFSAGNEMPNWEKLVLQMPTSLLAGPTTVHEVMPVDPEAKIPQPPVATAGTVVSKLPFNMGAALTSNAASARKTAAEIVSLNIFCLSIGSPPPGDAPLLGLILYPKRCDSREKVATLRGLSLGTDGTAPETARQLTSKVSGRGTRRTGLPLRARFQNAGARAL